MNAMIKIILLFLDYSDFFIFLLQANTRSQVKKGKLYLKNASSRLFYPNGLDLKEDIQVHAKPFRCSLGFV